MKGSRITIAALLLLTGPSVAATAQTPSRPMVAPGAEQQLTVVVPADQIANMQNDLSTKSATTDSKRLWIAMPYPLFAQVVNHSLVPLAPARAPAVRSGPPPGPGGPAATSPQPQPQTGALAPPAGGASPAGTAQPGSLTEPIAGETPGLSAFTSKHKAVLLVPASQLSALNPLRGAGDQAPVVALPVDRMNEIASLNEPRTERANFPGQMPSTAGSVGGPGGVPGQERIPVVVSLDQLKTFETLAGVDRRQVTIVLPFDEFPQVVDMKALAATAGR